MDIKKENKWGGARQGSGRSSLYKDEPKTRVHLYLTDSAIRYLEEEAKASGLSKSDLLNKLILEKYSKK